jgi:tetratricopeptide (TPR) repeat protein
MADRYVYLPSVGPFLVMGAAVGLIGERITASDTKKTAGTALLIVLCIFIVLLSNATRRQIHIWKDGVTLWNYELDMLRKKSDNNWFAYWIAYRGLGEDHLRKENYKDALNDYSEVIMLKPDDGPAYQMRGIAYAKLGRLKEAIKDFTAALAITPNSPALYYDRGTAFAKLGSFLEAVNDLTMAISISTKPEANYYLNRGLALKKLGRAQDSERDIAEAKKLRNISPERIPL